MKLKDVPYSVKETKAEDGALDSSKGYKKLLFAIKISYVGGEKSEEVILLDSLREMMIHEVPIMVEERFYLVRNLTEKEMEEVEITCKSIEEEFLYCKKYTFLREE